MKTQPFKGVRIYGPQKGRCNICGVEGELTDDHIPPKGCIEPSPTDLYFLIDSLQCNEQYPRHTQAGARFRTLCRICNSQRLGIEFDPELKRFAEAVGLHVRLIHEHGFVLPRHFTVNVKPQRVARAVIGHLLAAHVRKDMSKPPLFAPFPNAMRNYFLDSSAPLPDELTIYFWLYPSDVQVIIKNCGISALGAGTVVVGYFVKFFPLAYWVVFKKPDSVTIHHQELVSDRCMGIDDFATLTLDLSAVPRVDWPEHPGGYEFALLNWETAYIAKKRRRKAKM